MWRPTCALPVQATQRHRTVEPASLWVLKRDLNRPPSAQWRAAPIGRLNASPHFFPLGGGVPVRRWSRASPDRPGNREDQAKPAGGGFVRSGVFVPCGDATHLDAPEVSRDQEAKAFPGPLQDQAVSRSSSRNLF